MSPQLGQKPVVQCRRNKPSYVVLVFYLVAVTREVSGAVVSDRGVVLQNVTLYRVSCSTAIDRAFYVQPIKRGVVAI